jgi:hypothetical protein
MNLRLNISNAFFRKTFCITLGLLFSLNFIAGAAIAKGCDGGDGCISCAEPLHPHLPGMDMNMAPHGCQPLGQKGSCSFEIGSDLDQFNAVIPAVRTDQNEAGGIISAAAVDGSPAPKNEEFLPQPLYSAVKPTTPIYLIIHSLLC